MIVSFLCLYGRHYEKILDRLSGFLVNVGEYVWGLGGSQDAGMAADRRYQHISAAWAEC